MPDTFAVTVVFIVLAGFVAAFVRKRSRDKCLKDFSANMVMLEETNGEEISGNLNVENTGLEFVYPDKQTGKQGQEETSYILYKYEYPKIAALIRYHNQLSERHKKERERELERTYHPTLLRRLKRRTVNVFKTVRDSVMEVMNMLISQAKRGGAGGAVLTSQDKYVSQMKQELVGSVGTSFEPLLERYIGHRVVLELMKGEKMLEYCGVLKEYTAEFVEVMDVDYKTEEGQGGRKADLVVLRKYGVVRHLGE